MKQYKRILMLMLALVMCFALAACGQPADDGGAADGGEADSGALKVAFVYADTIGDYGWNYSHENARQEVQAIMGDQIETSYLEKITEGAAAEQVFTQLCNEGYDVIVAVTQTYEADVTKVAANFPDTIFLLCSGSSTSANVESYFPDRSALWYLEGMVAGMMTESNKIGFVGSFPSPLSLQPQNAFLLGAQSVNPDVEQIAVYCNTFYDPATEKDAAEALVEAGCDILWNNTNSSSHVQVAEEKGIYAFSQFEDQRQFGANSYLGGEFLNWAAYYQLTFEKILAGTFEPAIYYPDITTGVCKFQEWSDVADPEAVAAAEALYEEIMSGAVDPYELVWSGPITDNTGSVVVPEGEVLSADAYTGMSFFPAGTTTSN